MRLYYAPHTISVAAAITLQETGLAHELTRVDFRNAEQTKAPYLKLNPKGRVPTLALDDGTYLTETGAILEYIAARAPQAGLVPDTPEEAARMRSIMYYLASTMHVNHAHRLRGSRWADAAESHADMAAKVPQTMTASAAYLEQECLRGEFMLGERISLADPYAYVVCTWLEGDGVDLTAFARLSEFMRRMSGRASVQAVVAEKMLAP